MNKFPGYTRDPRDVGPQTVLRVAPENLSQVEVLEDQADMTSNPERQQELMYLAALERRFAQQAAQAQQGVQDAALSTNPLKRGDIIFGSPWQSMAKMERGRLRDKAAVEYNANLPAMYRGQGKVIGGQFYGA